MIEHDWKAASQALADDLVGYYDEDDEEVVDPLFVLILGGEGQINLRTALPTETTVALLPGLLRSVAKDLENVAFEPGE